MRCPRCGHPMSLGRSDDRRIIVRECSPCRARSRKAKARDRYSGVILARAASGLGKASVWALVFWAVTTASADTLVRRTGTVATCATACTTGPSSQDVLVDGATAVMFQYTIGGTSATIQVEQSMDAGATWSLVAGSSSSTTGTKLVVSDPLGWYRANVTACSACTFTVTYRAVYPR